MPIFYIIYFFDDIPTQLHQLVWYVFGKHTKTLITLMSSFNGAIANTENIVPPQSVATTASYGYKASKSNSCSTNPQSHSQKHMLINVHLF